MSEQVSALLSSEFVSRFGAFVLLVVTFVAAEWLWPRRARVFARAKRWSTNLAVFGIDLLVTTGMQSIAAVMVAYYARNNNLGLLNYLDVSPWLAFLLTLLVLDVAIYAQHVAFHKIPVLWRMHKVHHADPELDVSSALRFHPFEIALSIVIKALVVLLLGADPHAAVLFAIILNGGAMFNHANWKLPYVLDAALRLLIVTPDMHRVHHSNRHRETDSNYGFNLSVWDRVFRTYRAQPQDGHENMTIGLNDCHPQDSIRLLPTLMLPLRAMRPNPNAKQRARDAGK